MRIFKPRNEFIRSRNLTRAGKFGKEATNVTASKLETIIKTIDFLLSPAIQ